MLVKLNVLKVSYHEFSFFMLDTSRSQVLLNILLYQGAKLMATTSSERKRRNDRKISIWWNDSASLNTRHSSMEPNGLWRGQIQCFHRPRISKILMVQSFSIKMRLIFRGELCCILRLDAHRQQLSNSSKFSQGLFYEITG